MTLESRVVAAAKICEDGIMILRGQEGAFCRSWDVLHLYQVAVTQVQYKYKKSSSYNLNILLYTSYILFLI